MLLFAFYLISVLYCLWRIFKRYNKSSLDGIVGVTPALDTLIILFLAPLFMIVDLIVTYIQFRKDKH